MLINKLFQILQLNKMIISNEREYYLQTVSENTSKLVGGKMSKNEGYTLEGNVIKFIYKSDEKDMEVYVFGNFMGWIEEDADWRMSYNTTGKQYELTKELEEIKSNLEYGFYEFTFIVHGNWLDANKDAVNINYCPGYGYRYVIKELN